MERNAAPPFIVGETYFDRDGQYIVIAVEGNRLVLERENGTRSTADAVVKARIHQNILSERNNGRSLQETCISFVGNKPVGFTQSEVCPIIAAAIERQPNSSEDVDIHEEALPWLETLTIQRGCADNKQARQIVTSGWPAGRGDRLERAVVRKSRRLRATLRARTPGFANDPPKYYSKRTA